MDQSIANAIVSVLNDRAKSMLLPYNFAVHQRATLPHEILMVNTLSGESSSVMDVDHLKYFAQDMPYTIAGSLFDGIVGVEPMTHICYDTDNLHVRVLKTLYAAWGAFAELAFTSSDCASQEMAAVADRMYAMINRCIASASHADLLRLAAIMQCPEVDEEALRDCLINPELDNIHMYNWTIAQLSR